MKHKNALLLSFITAGILVLNSCSKNYTVNAVNNTSGAITTIAGNGNGSGITSGGYSGDGGAAVKAELNEPTGIAVDGQGNVYIADMVNNRIRKVSSAGTISTIAGDGTQGYSGDGGAAAAARLANPSRVAVDGAGNVYIVDTYNGLIRKITPSGTINTIAGNLAGSDSLNGSIATAVALREPYGVAVDANGNVYIADLGSHVIRLVTPSGTTRNIAGNFAHGYSGDNGTATAAQLFSPAGVAVDNSGNVYIVDYGNNRIRKVTPSGIISTLAGNGTQGYGGDNGPATAAALYGPKGVAVDGAGNVYIADNGNNRIRKVTVSGIISTIAGTGTAGNSGNGGPAVAAQLNGPYDVATDANGNVYIADTYNQRICRLNN